MGFIRSLFVTNPKDDGLNSDPVQNELVYQLITAAEGSVFQEAAMSTFVSESGWSRSEKELRFTHALAIVKQRRPDIFIAAKKIGQRQTA